MDLSQRIFEAITSMDADSLSLILKDDIVSPETLDFPNWNFGTGAIPLIQTVLNQDVNSCRVLLEEGGASPNVQDVQGLTPAHHAVQLRNCDILKLLISFGANLDITDHLEGRTPLHVLCHTFTANRIVSSIKINLFHLLLEHCNVNEVTKISKDTSLHILCLKNSSLESIIKPLCTHPDIDIDVMNENGQTPLIIALENGYLELASFLIGRGSDLSLVNKYGETSLLIACRKNHVSLVLEMLETNKCPTRNKDSDDNTPFHLAASRGYDRILRILIVFTNFRSIEDKNRQGKTPMQLAQDGQFDSIVKLLQEKNEERDLLL